MRVKQVPSWEKFPKPKSAELINQFRRAFNEVWIWFVFFFGSSALVLFIDKQITKVPFAIGLSVALLASGGMLRVLYLSLLGKARCPNCYQPPMQSSGLAFGIALRIKRCGRCDYPLTLEELEKDLTKEKFKPESQSRKE